MRTKHSATWDVQIIFDWLASQYEDHGLRFTAHSGPAAWQLHRHRAVAVTLIKLHHVSRSADVHSLSRGYFRGREGARLCLIGDEAACTIDKLRWWRPKTIGAGVGDYGPFKLVGDTLATPASPERAAYCMRTCLESYFRPQPRGRQHVHSVQAVRRVTDTNG